MKRVYVLLAALVLATGCGDSDTAPAANENRPEFVANLLPSNEVAPAVPTTSAEAAASGRATIHFNLTKDSAGTITAATADFSVELSGFPSTTVITAAHIHTGPVGVGGPVLVSAAVSSGQVTLTNGVGTFVRTGLPMTAAQAQSIINNPAGFYFNVHSTLHPSGVVRGPLVRNP